MFPIFLGCGEKKSTHKDTFLEKYTLQKIDEKVFSLDSVTSPLKGRISFFYDKKSSNSYVLLLNMFNNKLLWYDYTSRKLIYITDFMKEGKDGIGKLSAFSGFFIKSPDSIFVHNYNTATLYLCSKMGKVINTYKLINDKVTKYPYSTEFFATGLYRDTLIFNNWGAETFYSTSTNHTNDLLLLLSLPNKSLSYTLSYPSPYTKNIWGAQLHFMYTSFNPKTNDMLSSFPIDDSISIWNAPTKKVKRVYGGASFINTVKPLTTASYLKDIPDIEIELKNQLTQHTYGSIYADPYTGFSYRFVNQALTETEYQQRDPQRRLSTKLSIIIFNDHFQKVGEIKDLDFSYRSDKVFITNEGLHILKDDDTEDKMIFHVFKLLKL